MRTTRRASIGSIVIAGSLFAAGCGGGTPQSGGVGEGEAAEGEKGTFTVGILNPVSGPYAELGTDVNAGFETYLDGKSGVLSGYSIEVVKEDEGEDAGQAATKARQLVEQNDAQVVVGLVNSAIAYSVAPYLEEQQVPLLVTVAGADGLTHEKNGNIFRVSYTGSQDTMPAGDYACNELGYETAALVALDYSFGWEAGGGFARTFEDAGCDVIQEIYAPLGTQDWGPYVNQIDRAAEMVYVVAPGTDAIRLLKAYQGFGLSAPIVAHGATVDEQLLPSLGDAAEGVISVLHYSPQVDNPVNEQFVQDIEAAGKVANQFTESGYTAAMVLEEALSSIEGDVTSQKLRDEMAAVELDAPRGPQAFDEYGQSVYNVYVRRVENEGGQWINSVVETFSDVSQFGAYAPEEYLAFPAYEDLKGSWED